MDVDPKELAQDRFADGRTLATGVAVIKRCATDAAPIVGGLLDAVSERVGPGAPVAELGFGSGWLLEAMRSELPDQRLCALDLSAGNARQAHARLGAAAGIAIGDMERLPYRAGAFDVIVTCWTLYFMRDIDAALGEIKRCLSPGGRLIAAASARDHEIEMLEVVAHAHRRALGCEPAGSDIGARFDLETGLALVRRHFPQVELRRWHGEMAFTEIEDVLSLFPKWRPEGLNAREASLVRDAFEALARERLERDGVMRTRRRDGAFICDLS